MAYGKSDFVNFGDLELNMLSGEFTASEFEMSDDDMATVSSCSVKQPTLLKGASKPPKPKTYMCDECDKSYASISGIRGHLRSKHGKQDAQGKSSLTIQFVENQFVDSYDPTIENTFQKTVKISGQEYALQLIDTAGQDEYSILPQSYFMNIDGYILVYSVNSQKSFDVIKFVYDKLLDMKGNIGSIPVVLVGNKCDLAIEREVTLESGKRIAEKWKVPFLETSAKENQSVVKVFEQIVMSIERASGNVQEKNGCLLS